MVTTPQLFILLIPSPGRFIWLFISKLLSVALLSSRAEAEDSYLLYTLRAGMRFLASEDLVALPSLEFLYFWVSLTLLTVLFIRFRGS